MGWGQSIIRCRNKCFMKVNGRMAITMGHGRCIWRMGRFNIPDSGIMGTMLINIRNMDEFFKAAGMKPIGKAVYAGSASKKGIPKHIARKSGRCLE